MVVRIKAAVASRTAPARASDLCGLPVGRRLGHPTPHLLRRYVFLVGSHGPDMAEGIGDCAAAIAVELILERLLHRTASGDGFGELRIDVRNVEHQGDRAAAECLRALVAHLERLVREHYDALADLDFGVTDRAPRAGETHQFRGT